MKKEDKIIKKMLENTFPEQAPEGFTARVMESIKAVEAEKQERPGNVYWLYGLIVAGSFMVALGILTFIVPSVVQNLKVLFRQLLSGLVAPLSGFYDSAGYGISFLMAGTLLIMFILLIIDMAVWRKKRYAHILS